MTEERKITIVVNEEGKVVLPASKQPYLKEGALWCLCRICKNHAPLGYALETGTDNILICVECFRDKFPVSDTVTTAPGMHLAITKRLCEEVKDVYLSCVLCCKKHNPEFADGITFINQPNAPMLQKDRSSGTVSPERISGKSSIFLQKSTCGPKCLTKLRERLTNTIPEILFSCTLCDINVEKELRCTKCKARHYCSRDCQVTDWPRHKKFCVKFDE